MRPLIVKIQRSQPPFRNGTILVYTEDGSLWWQGKPDRDLNRWLGCRQKVFAYAKLKGTVFEIDGEAPWQEW